MNVVAGLVNLAPDEDAPQGKLQATQKISWLAPGGNECHRIDDVISGHAAVLQGWRTAFWILAFLSMCCADYLAASRSAADVYVVKPHIVRTL